MKYTQILFQINNISEVLAQSTESLYNKVYNLTRNFKVFSRKLVSDLIFAFTKHKSVSLIQFAKFSYKNNLLNSNKNIVASYSKFLSNNTVEKLSTKYINYTIKQLAKYNKTVFVAIDWSDIEKKFSKNSAMSTIYDGSKKTTTKWLPLETIVAFNDNNETVPLVWEVFSRKVNYKSDNTITMNLIRKVQENKPKDVKIVYVWDRWYATDMLFEHIKENKWDFIIRLKKNRHIVIKWKKYELEEWYGKLRKTKEKVRIRTKNKETEWEIYYGEVKLRTGNRRYYLVVAKNRHNPVMLLTTLKVESLEDAKMIIYRYSQRWLIEELYKYIKQKYELEKINLREWKDVERYIKRVNNFYNLLLIAIWLMMLWLEKVSITIKDMIIKLRSMETVGYKLKNIITAWLELIEDFVNVNGILQNQYFKKQVRKRILQQNPLF